MRRLQGIGIVYERCEVAQMMRTTQSRVIALVNNGAIPCHMLAASEYERLAEEARKEDCERRGAKYEPRKPRKRTKADDQRRWAFTEEDIRQALGLAGNEPLPSFLPRHANAVSKSFSTTRIERADGRDGPSFQEIAGLMLDRSQEILDRLAEGGGYARIIEAEADGSMRYSARSAESRAAFRELTGDARLGFGNERGYLDMVMGRVRATIPGALVQWEIRRLIADNPDASDKRILELYYEDHPDGADDAAGADPGTGADDDRDGRSRRLVRATSSLVRNQRRAVRNADGVAVVPVPSFSPRLDLSQGDRFAEVARIDEAHVELTVPEPAPDGSKAGRRARFVVEIPEFLRDLPAWSLPTVTRSEDGEVAVRLTGRKARPEKYEPSCVLALDPGVVKLLSAGLLSLDGAEDPWWSQTLDLPDSITARHELWRRQDENARGLWARIREEGADGRCLSGARARRLAYHRRLHDSVVEAKRANRRQIVRDVTRWVVDVAVSHRALVRMERLESIDKGSGSWAYRDLLSSVVAACEFEGIPWEAVSPAGTSALCPDCGSRLVQGLSHGLSCGGGTLPVSGRSGRGSKRFRRALRLHREADVRRLAAAGARRRAREERAARRADVGSGSHGSGCRGARCGSEGCRFSRVHDHDEVGWRNIGCGCVNHGSSAGSRVVFSFRVVRRVVRGASGCVVLPAASASGPSGGSGVACAARRRSPVGGSAVGRPAVGLRSAVTNNSSGLGIDSEPPPPVPMPELCSNG